MLFVAHIAEARIHTTKNTYELQIHKMLIHDESIFEQHFIGREVK